MATLIKTNGEITEVKPKNNKCFSLEELQEFVDGYIEIFWINDKRWVVNEEGLLDDLPENLMATKMLREVVSYPTQVLVGNVLITEEKELE